MKATTLFSGGEGAGLGMGYHRAGFDVTGVDIAPQKRYPFEFIQADALEYVAEHGHEYDVIHASPPCENADLTQLGHLHKHKEEYLEAHPNLIPQTRALLTASGKPYVIENVEGAAGSSPNAKYAKE